MSVYERVSLVSPIERPSGTSLIYAYRSVSSLDTAQVRGIAICSSAVVFTDLSPLSLPVRSSLTGSFGAEGSASRNVFRVRRCSWSVLLHPDLQRTTGEWVAENQHIGPLPRTEIPVPVVKFEFCALILVPNPWPPDGRSITGLGYFLV